MKKLFIIVAGLILGAEVKAQDFTLKSGESAGQLSRSQFYNGMGYAGDNLSPQLSWQNEPEGTLFYAITMYDPDAPTGSGFWHWVVFNIPSDCHELPSGAGNPSGMLLPTGSIQIRNDYGSAGYGGAAPNPGPAHRYIITVYALGKELKLNRESTPALVGFNLHSACLAKASIILYGKKE